MACPFFLPQERYEADWPFPHRLPLGAGWSGTCTAPGHDGVRPSDPELKSGCNLGYANQCERLPAQREADAVRFSMREEEPGVVHIRYACERDHCPVASGELVYESASGTWRDRHRDTAIQRMAECYLQAQQSRHSVTPADSAGQTVWRAQDLVPLKS